MTPRNEAAERLRQSMYDLAVTADHEAFLIDFDRALAAERKSLLAALRALVEAADPMVPATRVTAGEWHRFYEAREQARALIEKYGTREGSATAEQPHDAAGGAMTSEARPVTSVWIVARKSDGEAMTVYANEADANEDVAMRHRRHRDHYKVEAWQVLGIPAAAPAEGLPPEAIDWARQLLAQGYVDEHIVDFTESGYGLQHPIRCRPNLIGCQFNEWLATQMAPDEEPGRYLMTWRKNGPHYAALARQDPALDAKAAAILRRAGGKEPQP
jgi:hypothetical protein